MKKENLPEKICVVCGRPFVWRKKWEKVWDEVKYCSERCRGEKNRVKLTPKTIEGEDLERMIRMAWEDRTPFDAILAQFGLTEAETIAVMKRSLPLKRFEAWRDRVHRHGELKDRESRGFKLGVFKSRMQRIDGTLKRKK
jgi:uncharacterized protein (TIGR03643 family)